MAGRVVLPVGYDSTRSYPVVVMLPASNGTADAMLREYSPPGDVVVVLSAGLGTTDDYRTNEIWARTIERYERQLRADLDLLAVSHVDTSRVVLAGFSMGGDLAWALAVRNAARVKGAVVMGSRMSYRGPPGAPRDLRERGIRIAVVMGGDEDPHGGRAGRHPAAGEPGGGAHLSRGARAGPPAATGRGLSRGAALRGRRGAGPAVAQASPISSWRNCSTRTSSRRSAALGRSRRPGARAGGGGAASPRWYASISAGCT